MTDYHRILKEYVDTHAMRAMLQEGWAFKPAKSYGWQGAARGADFHVDQPLRTHILNGLFVLTRVLEFLQKQRYYTLSEVHFRQTLVLHTLHDAYKDKALACTRVGKSDFDISLVELDALYTRMGLKDFIDLTPADLRAASVALLSPKVGDISAGTPGITRLFPLVHLADALASQQTARDYRTAENRLREISKGNAALKRNNARILQRLEVEAAPENTLPELALYYHELDDYRGLSTLLIHQATEEALAPFGLYPLLYFANGVLYVGMKGVEADPDDLRKAISECLFVKIRDQGGEKKLTVAQEACDPRKGMRIEKYAYLFCSLENVLDAVMAQTHLGKAKTEINRAIPDGALYHVAPESAQNAQQCQNWLAATKLIMVTENIAQALVAENIPAWLFRVFHTPEQVAATIQQHFNKLNSGGVPNYCYLVAYHWMMQERFLADKRSWLEVDTVTIQHALKNAILQALASKDQEKKLLAFVEKELGIQEDLKKYLQANLIFSFAPERQAGDDPLAEYEKARRKSHKRLCTICNRLIPPSVKNMSIKTAIAEQSALVFSNRRLPDEKNHNDMMVWCPMCYLECMLRKLSGQSYPEGGDYKASYRLHLYILPDYAFTPELWKESGEELLGVFHPNSTTVTKLALRGSKEEPALPRRWLEQGTVDETLLKLVSSLFAEQAERMKTRGKQGDRLIFSFQHPNYMLFTYDNVVFKGTDSSLRPTRTEIWAKALYAATLIQLLIGARVYITDKPYLTFTRPEEMKTIIEMEGLPPLFSGLFPTSLDTERAEGSIQRASESSARLPLAVLSTMLDLFSAVWETNAALFPHKPGKMRRNLDKQIASILQEVNTNHLAGATLYKMRARDGQPSYSAFTRACHLLLPQTDKNDLRRDLHEGGYTLMLDQEGEAWMNLAKEITDVSLQLYKPNKGKDGRGRAHRFETLFRTGVEALKGNSTTVLDDDERIARVAGTLLKRLERLQENRQQGYVPLYGTPRIAAARQLAELLVYELFHNRCGQSIAKLTHEENNLADAIYFLTFEGIQRYWEEKKKMEEKEKTQQHDKASNEEDQRLSAD